MWAIWHQVVPIAFLTVKAGRSILHYVSAFLDFQKIVTLMVWMTVLLVMMMVCKTDGVYNPFATSSAISLATRAMGPRLVSMEAVSVRAATLSALTMLQAPRPCFSPGSVPEVSEPPTLAPEAQDRAAAQEPNHSGTTRTLRSAEELV